MYYLINNGAPPCTTLSTLAHLHVPPHQHWRTSMYHLINVGAPPCTTVSKLAHLHAPPYQQWGTSMHHRINIGAPPCTTLSTLMHLHAPPYQHLRTSMYHLISICAPPCCVLLLFRSEDAETCNEHPRTFTVNANDSARWSYQKRYNGSRKYDNTSWISATTNDIYETVITIAIDRGCIRCIY